MGAYMKRGFQGNVRGLSDQLGEQYSPGNMTINNSETTTLNSTETSESKSSDGTLTKQTSDSSQTQTLSRQASENIEALDRE
jgi:hypothetical protein